MMIDDECPFEKILKTFSNYNRTLQGSGGFPPNRSLFCLMLSTICSDYCDLPLGSYKKKSQEEPRQDLWSSRKKISIDHVAPQVGHKYQYQTMIEHMYTVLTWNIYSLSLSLSPDTFVFGPTADQGKGRVFWGTMFRLRLRELFIWTHTPPQVGKTKGNEKLWVDKTNRWQW